MNYFIGQELTLPKVRITETWVGVSGTKYYKTNVGVSFSVEELDKLFPPHAPRAAIEDYYPEVPERKVSKYEGMSNQQLHDHACSGSLCWSCPCNGYDCDDGLIDEHPELRHTLIAYLEAEDAARG